MKGFLSLRRDKGIKFCSCILVSYWLQRAQELRVLVLTEDSGSVPSNSAVAHNLCNSSSRRSDVLFWPPSVSGTHMVHMHTCKQNTGTWNLNIYVSLKTTDRNQLGKKIWFTGLHHSHWGKSRIGTQGRNWRLCWYSYDEATKNNFMVEGHCIKGAQHWEGWEP